MGFYRVGGACVVIVCRNVDASWCGSVVVTCVCVASELAAHNIEVIFSFHFISLYTVFIPISIMSLISYTYIIICKISQWMEHGTLDNLIYNAHRAATAAKIKEGSGDGIKLKQRGVLLTTDLSRLKFEPGGGLHIHARTCSSDGSDSKRDNSTVSSGSLDDDGMSALDAMVDAVYHPLVAKSQSEASLHTAQHDHAVNAVSRGGCFAGPGGSGVAWSWCERLRCLVDMAMGMDTIHKMRFIHSDLKPDNILVDASGRCKIADLGLARRHDRYVMTAGDGETNALDRRNRSENGHGTSVKVS